MKIIPVECSKCGKSPLGLNTECLKFDRTDEIRSFHFVKMYDMDYEIVSQARIECPECKTTDYVSDIKKTWKKEAERRINEKDNSK